MARGRPLSQDLRCSLIYMGYRIHLEDVVKCSGIPRCTVQHTFEDHWIEGHARHTRITEARRRVRKS
ncbi:hypothetical protein K435DRAFT_774334 [Dendrothele bispora CBS 962.96]|uniref:Uncharacterized protein n=1 Tax=Dendrothele bispora (strain CBS 962.96) TaxID=1314807 RepID=A0A4S8MP20_DENBC|nr:hypothetical protein K435DRAFT_774334 [Dendrothele bispora CBS 962.96]